MKKIKKQAILLTLTLILILMACNAVSAATTSNNSTTQLSTNNSTASNMNSAPSKVVISGKVLKCSDGTPFSGVTVTASKGGTKLAITTTGDDGTYKLSFLSNDNIFNVTASYPLHNSTSKEVNVNMGQNNTFYGISDFKLGGNVWVDPVTGKDDSKHGTEANPFKTIAYAISHVDEGGYIWLYGGTYAGTGNVNLLIDKSITIENYGRNPVIDGEGSSSIFKINNNTKDVTVTMWGLTLTRGHGVNGGAIYILAKSSSPYSATLNLNYCKFTSNNDGAIYCWNSAVNLYKCTFSGNTAFKGGAISLDGWVFIKNCTFNDNNATEGGAIWGNQGYVQVINSTFSNNRATNSNWGYGGGAIGTKVNLDVTNCSFTDNTASYDGAAIWNNAYSNVVNCTFTNNHAESGAIWNTNGGTCNIVRSNFIANNANYGAAIENYGTMTINTSIFDGNIAGSGGAISYLGKNLTIINSTFTNNRATNGGVIWNAYNSHSSTGPFNITGCIFTGNIVTAQGSVIWNDRGSDIGVMHFNSVYGNTGKYDVYSASGAIDAKNNWWGDNFQGTNPQSANRVNSNVDANPWVILTIKANPTRIDKGGTSTITADFNHINGGGDLTGGHIPDGSITLNVPWGSLNSNGYSLSEDTVNGVISPVKFYANGATVNPSYNPVKVTASADGYTTNEESAFITINTKTNLSITKTGPANVTAGNQITYTIKVTNNGPDYAADVVVSDILPANISNISWTAVYDGGATGPASGTGNLNLDLGILPNGGSCIITITGTVQSSTAASTVLTNTATVSTSTTETYPSDNSATVSTTVNTQSTLNVVKEALNQVTAGVTYTDPIYRITVTNNGPSDARDVQVTDNIPNQIVNREYRIDGGTWTSFTGDLNQLISYIVSGSSSIIEIRGKVLSSALAGSVSNNASASVYGNTFNSTSVITRIVTSAGVDLNETVNNSRPNVGDTATFTVTVHNNGPSDALNVQIQDLMPSDFTNVTVTPSKGTYNNGIWTLDLTSGETATLNLTGVVSSVMAGKNTTDTASYGSNSTNATIYVPKSNLYIKITASSNNPEVGEKFLITYKLGNYGPDAAENVTIAFKLPEGLDFVKVTADTGNCTYDPTTRTVTWTIDSVPVGDPYLYFTVKAAGEGTYKITPGIDSATYNSGSSGDIIINVQSSPSSGSTGSSTVNAASTISMQRTGVPLNYLILAIFMVLSGLIVPRRK